MTTIMSARAASLQILFSTSHTQIVRCLSLLFQLYFSRLRCRSGTCFLDNAVVISPFFQVPLIWADMKPLHVYFFPHLATILLSNHLQPHHAVLSLSDLDGKCGWCLTFPLPLASFPSPFFYHYHPVWDWKDFMCGIDFFWCVIKKKIYVMKKHSV